MMMTYLNQCSCLPLFSVWVNNVLLNKLNMVCIFQGVEEMDECSTNKVETRNLLDCRHPSPDSVLEPSFFSAESCNSSDSTNSNSTQGTVNRTKVYVKFLFIFLLRILRFTMQLQAASIVQRFKHTKWLVWVL